MSKIFREKSITPAQSPEQLNDYIRVTTPSVWLILLAIVFLLIGTLAWSILGTLKVVTPDGTTRIIHPITLIMN